VAGDHDGARCVPLASSFLERTSKMLTPDDFYPTNNQPSPLIGRKFTVKWVRSDKVVTTRTGMVFRDLVPYSPLTLIFEKGSVFRQVVDVEWRAIWCIELEGVVR
jgi:hypothetical protein